MLPASGQLDTSRHTGRHHPGRRDHQAHPIAECLDGTEFSQPIDFAMMGRSMGALGLRVSHHDEFVPAVQEALASGRPTVIDVLVAADAVPPPVAGRWAEPERDWPSPLPRGTLRHYTPDTWPG